MDLGIEGKRAAVAAASTGLGYASAQALVAEGVQVAICSRSEQRVQDAATRLGSGVIGLVADVANEEGARGFVRATREALGGVDILVANAGGPPPGQPSTTEISGYRHALELNLLSTIAMAQEALADMKQGGWGRIVAITSIGARAPIPFLAASSVARAGVSSFVKTLATEVASQGITINSAQPGVHATNRIKDLGNAENVARGVPVGELGSPEDFGKLVAFLCSDAAKFVTGTSLLADGGAYAGLI